MEIRSSNDVIKINTSSTSIRYLLNCDKEEGEAEVRFQESPKNSLPYRTINPDFFNFSFGYRHDTIGASPYGYTVKLAPQSRRKPPVNIFSIIF